MQLLLNQLYEHNQVNIPIDDKLTIFIGNNGSGKTTILNMIYNVMSSNFKPFMDLDFDLLTFIIEENDYKNPESFSRPLVELIQISKEDKSTLYVTYVLTNQERYTMSLAKHGLPFYELDLLIEMVTVPDMDSLKSLNNGIIYETVERISRNFPDLEFNIHQLKKSVLYFPTYRRIDSELLSLLEQNHNNRFEGDFENIKKLFDSLPTNNKIVGINDDDIDQIF